MARVKVSFEVEITEDSHMADDLLDVLRFKYEDTGELPNDDNPFSEVDLSPVFGTFNIEYL
jgi:hypothetical protein